MKRARLTNDRFIKTFFHNNPIFLKYFLIETLNLNILPSESTIKFLNIAFPPSRIDEYLKTADFVVKINKNIIVNLEINNMKFATVKERNFMYLSKLIGTFLKSGEDFERFRKYQIYQINLNANKVDRNISIREVKNIYTDNFEIYMPNVQILEIGLEHFRNLLYTDKENVSKKEYMLASFLSNDIKELNNILKKFLSNVQRRKVIKEVMNVLDNFELVFTEEEVKALDTLQMTAYYDDLKRQRRAATKAAKKAGRIQGLKQGIKEGLIEGKLEGIKEGKIEGIKQGKIEGIKQGKLEGIKQGKLEGIKLGKSEGIKESKIEIAKNLLAEKISVDIIQKVTGLSTKTIQGLML